MIDGLHARAALKSALFRKLLRVPAVGGGHADGGITAQVDGPAVAGRARARRQRPPFRAGG